MTYSINSSVFNNNSIFNNYSNLSSIQQESQTASFEALMILAEQAEKTLDALSTQLSNTTVLSDRSSNITALSDRLSNIATLSAQLSHVVSSQQFEIKKNNPNLKTNENTIPIKKKITKEKKNYKLQEKTTLIIDRLKKEITRGSSAKKIRKITSKIAQEEQIKTEVVSEIQKKIFYP